MSNNPPTNPAVNAGQIEPTDDRLEALELKLMDLENTVAELNEVIIRQYALIDRLAENHERLKDRVGEITSDSADDPANEPPPPHY